MAFEHNQNIFRIIDGVWLPYQFKDEAIRSGLNYVARPDDIFILTFPKSGTTWMETIVFGLLNNGRAFDDDIDYYMTQTPFLERFGKEAVMKMIRPGSIKTHLPFDRVPHHPQAKYICVIRNPKDVCVSFYRFVADLPESPYFNTKVDEYFNDFIDGRTPFGDYFKYIRTLWPHKDDENVLLVSYEQMQSDLTGVIRQVAQFLGIELNRELLERILTHSSFDYMKNRYDKARNTYDAQQSDKTTAFGYPLAHVRKGIVGDWSSYMSDEQVQRLDNVVAEMIRSMPELNVLWSSKPK